MRRHEEEEAAAHEEKEGGRPFSQAAAACPSSPPSSSPCQGVRHAACPCVCKGGREGGGGMRARLRLHARPISSSSESGPAKSLTTRVLASNSPRPPHYQRTKMCPFSACLACVCGMRVRRGLWCEMPSKSAISVFKRAHFTLPKLITDRRTPTPTHRHTRPTPAQEGKTESREHGGRPGPAAACFPVRKQQHQQQECPSSRLRLRLLDVLLLFQRRRCCRFRRHHSDRRRL